jgi:DNA adenine methylase
VAADHAEVILTDIQRAARFYYLQKMAFGGKVSGQTFGTASTSPPRMNLLRIEEELSAAHLRLARTYVEHLDWKTCIQSTTGPIPCSMPIRRTGRPRLWGTVSV